MGKPKLKNLIIAAIVLLVFVSAGILFLVVTLWNVANPAEAKLELLKFLLGFLLTVVFGSSVKVLIDEFNSKKAERNKKLNEDNQVAEKEIDQNRQKLELFNQFRKELLEDLYQIYSGVKKCRRLLRAKGITIDNRVRYNIYDKQIQLINDYQLDLELVKQKIQTDIDTYSNVFSDAEKLKTNAESMEKYLNRIIDQYEEKLKEFEQNSSSLPLEELDQLEDFIGHSKTSNFKAEFVKMYHSSLKAVREDILKSVKKPSTKF